MNPKVNIHNNRPSILPNATKTTPDCYQSTDHLHYSNLVSSNYYQLNQIINFITFLGHFPMASQRERERERTGITVEVVPRVDYNFHLQEVTISGFYLQSFVRVQSLHNWSADVTLVGHYTSKYAPALQHKKSGCLTRLLNYNYLQPIYI